MVQDWVSLKVQSAKNPNSLDHSLSFNLLTAPTTARRPQCGAKSVNLVELAQSKAQKLIKTSRPAVILPQKSSRQILFPTLQTKKTSQSSKQLKKAKKETSTRCVSKNEASKKAATREMGTLTHFWLLSFLVIFSFRACLPMASCGCCRSFACLNSCKAKEEKQQRS
jgi:hypothetical protein